MKIVIIIPTYNEKDNIEAIVTAIFAEVQPLPHDVHVLVVDDNSPDGTGKIVESLIERLPKLHLLKGEKNGIGDAYIRGFKLAMDKLQADVVFEMDADGQHPPKYIKPMIKVIEDGADVAVGTRYIPGGAIPKTWGIHRKLLSQVGNLVARILLVRPQFHDMTTGFRATRTTALRKVNLNGLLSRRFAYKIHLFHALDKAQARIVEVPIVFVDRTGGYSKMPRNEIFDSLRVIFAIRMYESSQIIKFLIVGTIGFLVNAILLTLLYDTLFGFFLPPQETVGQVFFLPIRDLRLFWASIISVEASIVSNFIFHEQWTFKHRNRNGKSLFRFLKFNLSSIVSPAISVTTVNILTPHFGLPKLISLAIGTLLGLSWNYLINILVIWRAHPLGTENKKL